MKGKKIKKIITAVLTVSVLAGMLTGCGSAKSSKTKEAALNEDGTVNTSDEVELVMYVISDRPAGQDVMDENLNAILKEKLNCTLKINWIGWAEYANKYPLLFSSGEQFDMAYASGTWLNYSSLAQKGAFMNLDELWETCAPGNFSRQSEEAKQQAMVNGHYYCVPTLLSTYDTYGPIYRTDIAEGTDWDGKMETMEDIEEYLDMVKEAHPEMEPLDVSSAGMLADNMYFFAQGYKNISAIDFLYYNTSEEAPQIKLLTELECVEDYLEIVNRWNEKGFFSKSALADTDTTKTQNGKAAMKIHNVDTYRDYAAQHPEYVFAFSNFVKNMSHLPYTQDCMVVSNTAQNPERALAFWDLVTSDQEVYNAFFYGVLGTTYEVNDRNEFKILDADLYATNAMYAARTDGLNMEQEGTPEDYLALKEGYEASITSGEGAERFTGFVFDTSSIETELSACQNVQQQYWDPLSLGYTDAESGLEEYAQKMETAGIEKIRQEAQRQLDEYLQKNK